MKRMFLEEMPRLDGQCLHIYCLWVIIISMQDRKVKGILYLMFGAFCFIMFPLFP